MFHVEHNFFIKSIIFVYFFIFAAGCNNIDKQPELKDKIYQDLVADRENAKKEIESAEKDVQDKKAELEKATPQTGQIKRAKEKYYSALNQLEKINQKYEYLKIKAESRATYVKKMYVQAYNNKKSLDLSSEEADYFAAKRGNGGEQMEWSAKKRVEESKKVFHVEQSGAHGEKPSGGHGE